METTSDILRELREYADTDSQSIGRDVLRRQIHHFADRLNTTLAENVNSEKVIYNAKMREALMQIRDSVYINPDDNECHSDIDASDLREICEAALAEPPRNCDLCNNPVEAWRAYVRIHPDDTAMNPLWHFSKWLYAEAKGGVK